MILDLDAPFPDWSPAGRQAFLREHPDVVRSQLRIGFDGLLAVEPRWFEEARWSSVDEAVDWAADQFATRNLDKARNKSLKLLTIPGFWLAQKLGKRGYAARRAKFASLAAPFAVEGCSEDSPPPRATSAHEPWLDVDDEELEELAGRLSQVLATLRNQTCAQLAYWWLEGTASLRFPLFGRSEEPSPKPASSRKHASRHRADAQCRFQVLMQRLAVGQDGQGVIRLQFLAPCPDIPPFRVPDAAVVRGAKLSGQRELDRLRRAGWIALLAQLLGREKDCSAVERLFLTSSLTPTTLEVYALDEGRAPELERQIRELPQPPRQGRKAR